LSRVYPLEIKFLHYITLRYVTLRYVTLRYVTLRYVTLRYVTLRYVTLRYVTLRYVTLRYITLHYITLHYTVVFLLGAWNWRIKKLADFWQLKKLWTLQGYISLILQHFATKLWNFTHFKMLFPAMVNLLI
jgi:hypothetical protein